MHRRVFESGAGLLHLARKSDKLMPPDPVGEAETLQWTIAALNSIEMVTVPWWSLKLCGDKDNQLTGWMGQRLDHLEKILNEREWLAADPRTDVWNVCSADTADARPLAHCFFAQPALLRPLDIPE